MFKEVKELQAEGFNIAQISKKLDIARQTVRKYMGYNTLPKRAIALLSLRHIFGRRVSAC